LAASPCKAADTAATARAAATAYATARSTRAAYATGASGSTLHVHADHFGLAATLIEIAANVATNQAAVALVVLKAGCADPADAGSHSKDRKES
jgi:hypothetical protein